jgi:hypothetical protein
LFNNETITIHITNLGIMDASGFSLTYQLNNEWHPLQAFRSTLNAGTGTDFNFTKPADLSMPGTYHVKAWPTFPSDPFHENDTLKVHDPSIVQSCSFIAWSRGFESTTDTILLSDASGLPA